MDDNPVNEIIHPTIDQPLNSPEIPFKEPQIDYKERNKEIVRQYIDGVKVEDISSTYGIAQSRVYGIVNKNKESAIIDREFEKARRITRLKRLESKAKNVVPKDATELVRVLDQQRKELEGDAINLNSVTNTQININSVQVSGMSTNQQLDLIRSLLDG